MAGLGAIGTKIHYRHGIGREDSKNAAGWHTPKRNLGLQDGQRAVVATHIQDLIDGYGTPTRVIINLHPDSHPLHARLSGIDQPLSMDIVTSSVVPLFLIIALGWASIRVGLLDKIVSAGLVAYVFYIATPALLIRSLINTRLPSEWPWALWLSYFLPALSLLLIGTLISWRGFRRPLAAGVVSGFASAFSNGVLIGAPVILGTLGPEAALPYFLLISLHSPIMFPTASLALELCRGNPGGPVLALRECVKQLLQNPIILSLAAGLLLNAGGIHLPSTIDKSLDLLAASTAPTALFATGAQLAHYHIQGALAEALVISAMKLLLMPALVFCLAAYVFGLTPIEIQVATTLAALPSGVNAYLLGTRYQTGLEVATTAIVLSTLLSIATLTVWVVGLSPRGG